MAGYTADDYIYEEWTDPEDGTPGATLRAPDGVRLGSVDYTTGESCFYAGTANLDGKWHFYDDLDEEIAEVIEHDLERVNRSFDRLYDPPAAGATVLDVSEALVSGKVFATADHSRVIGLDGEHMWDADLGREMGGSGQSHWVEGHPCEYTGARSFVRGVDDSELEGLADMWNIGSLECLDGKGYLFADGMSFDEFSQALHDGCGPTSSSAPLVLDCIVRDGIYDGAPLAVRVEVPFDGGAQSADLWVRPDEIADSPDAPGRSCLHLDPDRMYTVDLDMFPGDRGHLGGFSVCKLADPAYSPRERLAMSGREVVEHVDAGRERAYQDALGVSDADGFGFEDAAEEREPTM